MIIHTMFTEQTFNIPDLKGISKKNIEEHLKLYAGYVKHANLVMQKIAELTQTDAEKYSYEISELHRRFSFEFNGMRNHEVYFKSLEKGAKSFSPESPLAKMIAERGGSFDAWLAEFKAIALTRGIGWACAFFDPVSGELLNAWVDEQHLGQLQNCALILGLDMWEHSYVADYQPSGKKQYVEDFFANVNWSVIEQNFAEVS
ncbi:MAG: Fe-Mn family superoxide dismutase [bacterium]|nr:Fe-Mn family superoxide dismutase [bacterium]